jgi:hypothetical protein
LAVGVEQGGDIFAEVVIVSTKHDQTPRLLGGLAIDDLIENTNEIVETMDVHVGLALVGA